MKWRLAKSLKKLFDQINEDFPKRSKASDGSVGDLSHSKRKSDHNPNTKGVVCAIDITNDPANGMDCNKLAAALVKSKDPRIKYIIWNRQISSSTNQAWKWRNYSGSNPHNKHLHISANGKYDVATAWKINLDAKLPSTHPDPNLIEFGDKGFAVTNVQTKLAELGYLKKSEIDGIFGNDVHAAVTKFQNDNGLDADGIVGEKTSAALNSGKPASTASPVKPASIAASKGKLSISRKSFFDGFREMQKPKRLTQKQVEALEGLLGEFEKDVHWQDLRHIAYALATIFHETARTFRPIREFRNKPGSKGRKNQDRYWGSGYYGRGYVQLTWDYNYKKAQTKTGIKFVANPDLALVPENAFKILTLGMHEGWFTTHKLSGHISGSKCDYVNARRIINGTNEAARIAGYARKFEKILTASSALAKSA